MAGQPNRPDKNEQMAESFLRQAGEGQDISHTFNHMTVEDQRQVFAMMKGIQAKAPEAFGNVELIDHNKDGRLDDIIAHGPDGSIRDVYDTPPEQRAKTTAQKMLDLAKNGQNVQRLYDQAEDQKLVLHKIGQIQTNNPDKYGNVRAIDRDGDGIMDDMTALVNRGGRVVEADVYDDPRDAREKTIQKEAEQTTDRVLGRVTKGQPIGKVLEEEAGRIFRKVDPRRRN